MKKAFMFAIGVTFALAASAQAGVLGSATQELNIGGIGFANAKSVAGLSASNMSAIGFMESCGSALNGQSLLNNRQYFGEWYGTMMIAAKSSAFTHVNPGFGAASAFGKNSMFIHTPNTYTTTNIITRTYTVGSGTAFSSGWVNAVFH